MQASYALSQQGFSGRETDTPCQLNIATWLQLEIVSCHYNKYVIEICYGWTTYCVITVLCIASHHKNEISDKQFFR